MASLPRLRRAFQRMFHAGAEGVANPRQAKRIILANQIACSVGALCFFHIYIDHAMGADLLAWLNIPIGLGYFGVLLLNRAGRTWASRFLLTNYAALHILVYALALGKDTALHLFFLPACWAPLVLFGWEERRSLLYGMILHSSLLVACELWLGGRGLLHPLSPELAERMHSDTVITTLVIQILIAAYFILGSHRAETALGAAMEAARAADRAKSRFLANMSHEIRTPLNGILGISRLLAQSGLAREKREMAETILSSSEELMVVLNGILDLAKIEAGRMQLEAKPFRLDEAVAAVIRPFGYEARLKGLALAVERDPAAPDWVLGDSVRFKQVLRNLLGNAFKFTSEGGITVRIRRGEAGDILAFEVEDTGPGIPEAARDRIFHPFSQADDSTTRQYGGTGLGLAICKQIVELMGGTIAFRNRSGGGRGEGSGAVFAFAAPFPAAAPPEAPSDPGAALSPQPPDAHRDDLAARAAGLRFLVVDDHPVNRKVLAALLGRYRIQADKAVGGKEALEACAVRAYDFVFTDCHMPGMDGLELTRRLRERSRSWGAGLRIVGVTADVMAGTREQCLQAGMDEVLSKPVIEADLERILARVLPAPPAAPDAAPGTQAAAPLRRT